MKAWRNPSLQSFFVLVFGPVVAIPAVAWDPDPRSATPLLAALFVGTLMFGAAWRSFRRERAGVGEPSLVDLFRGRGGLMGRYLVGLFTLMACIGIMAPFLLWELVLVVWAGGS